METILAFCAFAFVASITPGPTNFLILSTSQQFGINKSCALIAGASVGAALLVLLVGLGLGQSISYSPALQLILSVAGGLWLTVLAWKIFHDQPNLANMHPQAQQKHGFWAGFLMQLINPKSWLMAIAVMTVYLAQTAQYSQMLVILTLLFMLIAFPCLFVWAWLGQMSQKWLSNPGRVAAFNKVLGVILLISVWHPILKLLIGSA